MKVAVTWQMCGYVDIDAPTMEEAMEIFEKECDYIKLPKEGYCKISDFKNVDWF